MFAATMCACAVDRRLSSCKNGKTEESKDEQPLIRNHDYPEPMNILSCVRIDKQAEDALPHFTNNGGKAARLLKVLGPDDDTEPKSLMDLLPSPPGGAVEECRA